MEDTHTLPQGNLVFAQSNSVSNFTPAAVDKYIDVLEFGENGELFLATSNLNRRSWTGDIWWFAGAEDAPRREKAKAGYRLDSGIVRVKYIGNRQLVLGLDSGGIQLITLKTKKPENKEGGPAYFLELNPSPCEHDDRIADLDTWKSREVTPGGQQVLTAADNQLVTAGQDGRIVVWNKNQAIVHNLHPAHSSGVISVSCHPTNNNIFASAGQEGEIKVWDVRDSRPCETVYSDPAHPPAAISWYPGGEDRLLVATRTGTVFTIDVGSKKAHSHQEVADRELRNISWSIDRPHLAAVSGDDVTVIVLNTQGDKLSVEYTNSAHKDFVRALCWSSEGTLWSGGWDTKVIKHTI